MKSKRIGGDLVSGGIIGLVSMLKEIIKGQKHVRTIDHQDRKLMFETNSSGSVIFVLLVTEELKIFRKKLDRLVIEFEKRYSEELKEIESTGIELEKFKELKVIARRIFGV